MDDEIIIVDAVVREKTFVGKVNFPIRVPEGLAEYLVMPGDFLEQAETLGLSHRDVQFILGVTRGRPAMSVELNLADLAPKLGMSFAEIDGIVCELIKKGYAEMNQRLNIYRLWVTLLRLKGIRFDVQ